MSHDISLGHDVFDLCLGGCRGKAFAMTGDLYGKDPDSCFIYGKW